MRDPEEYGKGTSDQWMDDQDRRDYMARFDTYETKPTPEVRCKRCVAGRSRCARCNGSGWPRKGDQGWMGDKGRCSSCAGVGTVQCPSCGGVGIIPPKVLL